MKTSVVALTAYSAWNSSGHVLLRKFSEFVCFKSVYVCSKTMEFLLLCNLYAKSIYSETNKTGN
jgi:hypothetical protein